MAKNKYTNPNEKKLIWRYYEKNTIVQELSKIFNFSRGQARNSIF